MTPTDPFYQASGASPPSPETPPTTPPPSSEPLALPPELVEALARLFADAIIVDIRKYQNLAELKANREVMVESPSGLNRRRRAGALAGPPGPARHSTPRLARAG